MQCYSQSIIRPDVAVIHIVSFWQAFKWMSVFSLLSAAVIFRGPEPSLGPHLSCLRPAQLCAQPEHLPGQAEVAWMGL